MPLSYSDISPQCTLVEISIMADSEHAKAQIRVAERICQSLASYTAADEVGLSTYPHSSVEFSVPPPDLDAFEGFTQRPEVGRDSVYLRIFPFDRLLGL